MRPLIQFLSEDFPMAVVFERDQVVVQTFIHVFEV